MFSHKNTKNTENLGLRPRPQKPFVNFVHFVAKNERLGGEVTKTRIEACGLTRRDIGRAGAGLAAVVASGKAPAMLLGARQFFMGGGKPTAKDYICDAAQVHFDGIENDGYGVHSDNRISNLVNSNQFAYAFNASYGKTTADSLCGSFYQSTSNRSMKFNCSNTGYTMEWCGKWRNCEVPFGTLFAGCLQFRNDQRVAFWYGSSSKYVFLPIPISDTQRQGFKKSAISRNESKRIWDKVCDIIHQQGYERGINIEYI